MKKLLIATSALVAAAGSAAALDVTLGGEIEITTNIDMDNSGFNGADWGAELTIMASGESMGWTYGGTMEIGMFDAAVAGGTNTMALELSSATVYMGGDFMGKIAISDGCGDYVDEPDKVDWIVNEIEGHCLEWTGMELGGMAVSLAMSVEDGQDDMVVGLSGDVMGFGLIAEYDVNSEDYEAVTTMSMQGLDLGLAVSYDHEADDEYDYSVSVGTNVGDFGVVLEYAPENLNGGKDVMAEVNYGDCWGVELGIDPESDDDQGIYMWEIGYECDLHDGFEIEATIGEESGSDTITGTLGATLTF